MKGASWTLITLVNTGSQDLNNIKTDTSTDRVLVSDDFIYWGDSGPSNSPFRG